jgi:hypothetical protein
MEVRFKQGGGGFDSHKERALQDTYRKKKALDEIDSYLTTFLLI